MIRKLLIRDLTLRDGQQSAFATRMSQAQIDRVLPYYKDAGFYAMEVWGGAVPDSVMRYAGERISRNWHVSITTRTCYQCPVVLSARKRLRKSLRYSWIHLLRVVATNVV